MIVCMWVKVGVSFDLVFIFHFSHDFQPDKSDSLLPLDKRTLKRRSTDVEKIPKHRSWVSPFAQCMIIWLHLPHAVSSRSASTEPACTLNVAVTISGLIVLERRGEQVSDSLNSTMMGRTTTWSRS